VKATRSAVGFHFYLNWFVTQTASNSESKDNGTRRDNDVYLTQELLARRCATL